MERVLVYGQGGHSKVIQMMIAKSVDKQVCLIADDDKGKEDHSKPVKTIHPQQLANHQSEYDCVVVAIGTNATRKKVVENYKDEKFATIIDPTAAVARNVLIGVGTVVMPMSVINPSAIVGKHCIVNTSAIIEHDCQIGDYTHISPGAILTGAVQVGSSVHIGANATILPGILIGDHATIGAGAVVTKNIKASSVVIGNPAREMTKERDSFK